MRWRRFIFVLWLACASLAGCGTLYDDTGAAYPGQYWPWVCPDGSRAPDGGCPPAPSCSDGGALDGGSDGGC